MINNYAIEKNLGEGSFAQVKLCRDINTGIQYAIKLMNKKELKRKKNPNGTSAYECVLEEIKVLQRLEHPNIIWLHEIIDDPLKDDYIYLVTEYHSKGSLGDHIKNLNDKFNDHN
jgi:serine/threonine protein kinase